MIGNNESLALEKCRLSTEKKDGSEPERLQQWNRVATIPGCDGTLNKAYLVEETMAISQCPTSVSTSTALPHFTNTYKLK
jgi:hypothetical protein